MWAANYWAIKSSSHGIMSSSKKYFHFCLITRCQFYYMDQFLLSASSNQLFVHQIGLPSQQNSQTLNAKTSSMDEFWFKYAHQVKLENCKNITAICAPNQVGPTYQSRYSVKLPKLVKLQVQRWTKQLLGIFTIPYFLI